MSRASSLDLLHTEFGQKVHALLDLLEDSLPYLRVFETVRSPAQQAQLFQRGRNPNAEDFGRTVTRAAPYQSAHQYGMAADFVFFANGAWSWDEPHQGAWDELSAAAQQVGLVTLSFERPHVQSAGFDWRQMDPGPLDDVGWLRWLTTRV